MDYPLKVDHFKKFLALSVEGPSTIPTWIQSNFFDKKIDSTTLKAFFEGERELINIYLYENKETELIRLIKEFIKIGHPGINRIQLGILTQILKEEDFLTCPNGKSIIAKAFNVLKDFAIHDANPKIHNLWEEARKHLGDEIDIDSTQTQKPISRDTNFVESLKILPPKSYLFRYKCIFDIWEEIINKTEDTQLMSDHDKITLPKPENLSSTSVCSTLSALKGLYNNLESIKTSLEPQVASIKKQEEKANAEDSQILILNHDVDGCLLSLIPFLSDLAELTKHLDDSELLPIASTLDLTETLAIGKEDGFDT